MTWVQKILWRGEHKEALAKLSDRERRRDVELAKLQRQYEARYGPLER